MCVSMGEGQDVVANRAIGTAVINGTWVLLQNCHLGLDFMETIEDLFAKIAETVEPEFRLFFTCEPHPKFPIGLLQMAWRRCSGASSSSISASCTRSCRSGASSGRSAGASRTSSPTAT